MGHYWTADDHAALRQAQIEDWLEDLEPFEVDIVATACREWRRHNNRRPTPHDIRVLAIAAQDRQHPRPTPNYIPPPARPEHSPQEIAEVEAQCRALRTQLRVITDNWQTPSVAVAAEVTQTRDQLMSKHARFLMARGQPEDAGSYWSVMVGSDPDAARRLFDEVDHQMRESNWDDNHSERTTEAASPD